MISGRWYQEIDFLTSELGSGLCLDGNAQGRVSVMCTYVNVSESVFVLLCSASCINHYSRQAGWTHRRRSLFETLTSLYRDTLY